MNFEPVTILTAALPDLDYYENLERINELRLELLNKGYSIVGVKMNGLQAFLVTTANFKPLIKLAKRFKQSHLFTSDENRLASKIDCLKPKTVIPLGKLEKKANGVKIDLSKQLNLTFIEDGKQYVFSTEL